jgi:serine/threonine-protein kinase
VYTCGIAHERFFLAIELVEGGTLEKRAEAYGGLLPEEEGLRAMGGIASGLQAAHAAGLLHRDVKPGNILFSSDGTAKIVDFGLASRMGAGEISGVF